MKELYDEAARLAGRPVEVDKTTDGKYIVLWMNFGHRPPEKGVTEEEALTNFINMMKEYTDGRNDGDNPPDPQVVT